MVSVVRTVKNTERLAQIGLVLARHGFGEIISRLPLGPLAPVPAEGAERRTLAVRVREALQDLGPSFVKLGQVMSTRPDVLPSDVVSELKKLQDDVPPMTAEEVDEVLAEAYGEGLDAVFASFDRSPLASASIGQVHLARLRVAEAEVDEPGVAPGVGDGDAEPTPTAAIDVVVKLQRPRARATVERDLDLLYVMARLLETHVPESRSFSPLAMVAEFDRAITAELDTGLEADNALRFQRNFEGHPEVRFPTPYRHASAKRALVMERFVGSHLDEFVPAGDEGTGPRIARRALGVIAKMVFEDGFFHADPHPGNIIMMGTAAEPVLGLIDLGLVGRLSEEMRDKAIQLMLAAVTGDAAGLADSLLAMGRPKGRVDLPRFRAEVAELSDKYLGRSLADVEMSAVIRDLIQGAIKYDIEMPAEMLMVGKALMTVEGIGKQLDPELDVWIELRPYFTKLMMERFGPRRLGRDLLRGVRALTTGAVDLPGQVHDILDDLRGGKLVVTSRDPELSLATERLGRRLFTAIGSAALLGAATALFAVDRHPTLATAMLVIAGAATLLHLWGDRRRGRAR
jgi:ubiquinone biosynthesis protein